MTHSIKNLILWSIPVSGNREENHSNCRISKRESYLKIAGITFYIAEPEYFPLRVPGATFSFLNSHELQIHRLFTISPVVECG